VRSKFSCVRSSHDMGVHAHAHSLEGTLTTMVGQKFLRLPKNTNADQKNSS